MFGHVNEIILNHVLMKFFLESVDQRKGLSCSAYSFQPKFLQLV